MTWICASQARLHLPPAVGQQEWGRASALPRAFRPARSFTYPGESVFNGSGNMTFCNQAIACVAGVIQGKYLRTRRVGSAQPFVLLREKNTC
jgi:hypothetical protein